MCKWNVVQIRVWIRSELELIKAYMNISWLQLTWNAKPLGASKADLSKLTLQSEKN